MTSKSKLIEYKNMYVVLLPDETHIICMGSDGTWDDNYDCYYNYYNHNYDYYNYNHNYYYNYNYCDYNYCDYNYCDYTPLINNPFKE